MRLDLIFLFNRSVPVFIMVVIIRRVIIRAPG
jgi:hypothetical protein